MGFLDGLRSPELVKPLIERIRQYEGPQLHLMEVCGTHTVAIFRHGLRDLLPPSVRLLSGPGCPVCVTPNITIDRAIAISRLPGVALATFGDMIKVPGSRESLAEAMAEGADVRVVYSPLESIEIARREPSTTVVLFGIGFETTAPTTAACVQEAARHELPNFLFLSAHKLVPPAMAALLEAADVRIDGFLCPGHVSAIIGTRPYDFVASRHGVGCVVAGFEAVDILHAIAELIDMRGRGPAVVNGYRRVVREQGNARALETMAEVFTVSESTWRGIGPIPGTGLELSPRYAHLDALQRLDVKVARPREARGCRCGEVLRGAITPPECGLFGGRCTPESPVGPCMVSTEGTCAAWLHYSATAREVAARRAGGGR